MSLIPCAYCGGDVEFHKHEDGSTCLIIICTECRAVTDLSYAADPDEKMTLDEVQEKIIQHWNRRCPEVAEQARDRILRASQMRSRKNIFRGWQMDDIVEEIQKKLMLLQLGKCTCMTMTNEIQYHNERCTYRLVVEVSQLVGNLISPSELEIDPATHPSYQIKIPCQNKDMGEHACSDRSQCWEPCGELGHSAEHARTAPKALQEAIEQHLAHPVDLTESKRLIAQLRERIKVLSEANEKSIELVDGLGVVIQQQIKRIAFLEDIALAHEVLKNDCAALMEENRSLVKERDLARPTE